MKINEKTKGKLKYWGTLIGLGMCANFVLKTFTPEFYKAVPEAIEDYFTAPEKIIAEKIIELPKIRGGDNFKEYSTTINGIKYSARVEGDYNGNINEANNLTLKITEGNKTIMFEHSDISGDLDDPFIRLLKNNKQVDATKLYNLKESIRNRFEKQYETFFKNGFEDSLNIRVDSIEAVRYKNWLEDKEKYAQEELIRNARRDSVFQEYLKYFFICITFLVFEIAIGD